MYKTLVYSPEVQIHIEGHDVSADVVSGNISLVVDGISSLSFVLSNRGLRYSNLFKRMDRIHVKMKRIGAWIPVFTGYLDVVPGLQLYPGTVQLKASCTLKVLKYTYWDPGLPESQKLLNQMDYDYWGNYGGGSGSSTGNPLVDAAADLASGQLGDLSDQAAQGAAMAIGGAVGGPAGAVVGALAGGMLSDAVKDIGDDVISGVADAATDAVEDPGDLGLEELMSDDSDSGLGVMLKNLLIQVGGWAEEEIKVQEFPKTFLAWVAANMPVDELNGIYTSSLETFREMFDFYKGSGGGTSSGGGGGLGDATFTDIGPPANGSAYSDDELAWIALNGGWKGEDAAMAVAIMKAESGGNPGASNHNTNGTMDKGLWQINDVHNSKLPGEDRYDPAVSTRLARMIYEESGNNFSAWSTVSYNSAYAQHMDAARAAVARGGTAPPGAKGGNSGGAGAAAKKANDATKSKGGGALGGTGALGAIGAPGGDNKDNKTKKAAEPYGMPNGTQIGYGAPGFPDWVYSMADQFGLQASTYPSHQEDNRIEAGYAPNPELKNRGIDWSGPVDKMQAFAEYLFSNAPSMPQLEQIIWCNPGTGQKIGWGGGTDQSGTGYYSAEWAGHQNHVHTRQSQSLDGSGSMAGVGAGGAGGGGGVSLLAQNLFTYMFDPSAFLDPNSGNFTGKYASINDEPIMNTVEALCTASLRSYRSAPDGKFLAFYPDYFGLDGTAPSLILEDIEMKDVRIDLNDASIATHVFTMGSENVYATTQDELGYLRSAGVVTIEDEWMFKRAVAGSYFPPETTDPMEFMQRYGIRPYKRTFKQIQQGDGKEAAMLVLGIKEFMDRWARQYQTRIELTFMPELFPGMRVELSGHDLVLYVVSVNHSFSYESGFTTTAEVMAPMKTDVTAAINAINEPPEKKDSENEEAK